MNTFLTRMRATVEPLPVWRSLKEKMGDSALIAWALVGAFSDLRLLTAGIIAILAYLIIGKVRWYVLYRTFDLLDTARDLGVTLVVLALALTGTQPLVAGLIAVAWAIAVYLGPEQQ